MRDCGGDYLAGDHRRLWQEKGLLPPAHKSSSSESGRQARLKVVDSSKPTEVDEDEEPIEGGVQEKSWKRRRVVCDTDADDEEIHKRQLAVNKSNVFGSYLYMARVLDHNEKYPVPMLVSDIRVMAIYDTGCSHTMMSRKFAVENHIGIVPCATRYKAAKKGVLLETWRTKCPINFVAANKPSFSAHVFVAYIADGDVLYVGNGFDEKLGITVIGLPTTYPDTLTGLE